MQPEDTITKLTQIIQREDGSEVRIVAQAMFGAGLHRSINVMVHRRENAQQDWKLCNDRPHPDWMKMSVSEYIERGRSEVLQVVSPGEILKVTNAIGKPMSHAAAEIARIEGKTPPAAGDEANRNTIEPTPRRMRM